MTTSTNIHAPNPFRPTERNTSPVIESLATLARYFDDLGELSDEPTYTASEVGQIVRTYTSHLVDQQHRANTNPWQYGSDDDRVQIAGEWGEEDGWSLARPVVAPYDTSREAHAYREAYTDAAADRVKDILSK